MATDNGRPSPRVAREHIEVLHERHEYLLGKKAKKKAEGLATGYEEAEIVALEWTFPLLEAEWQFLVEQRRLEKARPQSE